MKKKNPYQAHVINFKHIFFDFFRWSGWPFLLWYRIKKIYETKEQPKHVKGGAIVIANHILYSDVMVLFSTFWYRRLQFLIMKEMMDTKAHQWFFEVCGGCVGVDREKPSLQTVRKIVLKLQGGNLVGMFPEGHVSFGNENPMSGFKSGAVLMAYQAGVPIVPTYREIRKSIWHRQRIVIGAPIDVKAIIGDRFDVSKIDEVAKLLFEKEQELKKIYHEEDK